MMKEVSERTITVIFDFDGTLADTIALVMRIYNEHAESFSAEKVESSELSGLRKLGYRRALKAKHIKWHHLPKLVAFVRKEMKQHMGEVQPYPGVVSMLHQLKERGVTIGVLTSNDQALVQDFFVAHGFPLFDFIVSDHSIFGKDKALYRIMSRHGLGRENVVYVGDEARDIIASKKAGIRSIGVGWGGGGREMLEKVNPTILVDSVDELTAALAAL